MAYSIDSTDFSTYNLRILSCMGALDFPKRIGDIEYNWGDSNGIEAYTDADELFFDGRKITLKAYYYGSSLMSDLETFISTYKGASVSLETTFGTFTVKLQAINGESILRPESHAILVIEFWQKDVTINSAPVATGGTGITLGGFDFFVDFGLNVKSVSGLYDIPNFSPRQLTYQNIPEDLSQYRNPRSIRVELNGSFTSVAALISAVNNLMYMVCSAGMKTLSYRGNSFTCYFADGASVEVNLKAKTTILTLTLRVVE